MQIRKTYRDISPTLLFDEIRDFVLRKGIALDQNRLETYSIPSDSSSFIYRGTLTAKIKGQEGFRAYITGTDKAETKLMLDSNDELFPKEQVAILVDELNFMLGPFEPKQ